jgi:hypothetical protein
MSMRPETMLIHLTGKMMIQMIHFYCDPSNNPTLVCS